jgi:hypothetical protein
MPICLNGAKDVRHALFTCDRAREVWCALSLEQFIEDALAYDREGLGFFGVPDWFDM